MSYVITRSPPLLFPITSYKISLLALIWRGSSQNSCCTLSAKLSTHCRRRVKSSGCSTASYLAWLGNSSNQMLPKHLTWTQFPWQIESLPAKPLSAQFKWGKEKKSGITTSCRAHTGGSAGHLHQTDPQTAAWAWGIWTAQALPLPCPEPPRTGDKGQPNVHQCFLFCHARWELFPGSPTYTTWQ